MYTGFPVSRVRIPYSPFFLNGPLVKWLRHRPFTAVTWVQIPYGSLHGGLAQLGERLPYKQRVTGSSPVSSIMTRQKRQRSVNGRWRFLFSRKKPASWWMSVRMQGQPCRRVNVINSPWTVASAAYKAGWLLAFFAIRGFSRAVRINNAAAVTRVRR